MSNSISSGAIKEPVVKDPAAEADIPTGYGKTESYLLPKDPAWLFLFWEITQNTFDCIKQQYNESILKNARTIIRLHDVTEVPFFDGTNSTCY